MTRPTRICPTCGRDTAPSAPRPRAPIVWFTVADVARLLGVSKMTVYREVNDDVLEAHRFGRGIRIAEAALDRYLDSARVRSGDA